MRIKSLVGGLMAALVITSVTPAASLAGVPKYVLLEAARPAPDGRQVHVMVGQEEIKSAIDVSRGGAVVVGGLLGALIDIQIQAERAKKAEAAILPLRAAMTGFDADTLAQAAARSAVDRFEWFHPVGEMSFGRDMSSPGLMAALDASRTPQMAFVSFVYEIAPDFKSMRVNMVVSLANRDAPPKKSPAWRLGGGLVYAANVTSVIALNGAGDDINANARMWAENDAAKAREALTMAFADVAEMAPRAFLLTQAEAKAMMRKPHKSLALDGFVGREQERPAPGERLLFNGGFIHFRSI
jgi:hypothetical protein